MRNANRCRRILDDGTMCGKAHTNTHPWCTPCRRNHNSPHVPRTRSIAAKLSARKRQYRADMDRLTNNFLQDIEILQREL